MGYCRTKRFQRTHSTSLQWGLYHGVCPPSGSGGGQPLRDNQNPSEDTRSTTATIRFARRTFQTSPWKPIWFLNQTALSELTRHLSYDNLGWLPSSCPNRGERANSVILALNHYRLDMGKQNTRCWREHSFSYSRNGLMSKKGGGGRGSVGIADGKTRLVRITAELLVYDCCQWFAATLTVSQMHQPIHAAPSPPYTDSITNLGFATSTVWIGGSCCSLCQRTLNLLRSYVKQIFCIDADHRHC